MIHECVKLDWGEVHAYKRNENSQHIDLTLPFETMEEICREFNLSPELGAGEAQYNAFRTWLEKHDGVKELFYDGKKGFDILSLVHLFDFDLKQFSRLIAEKNIEELEHPIAN